MKNTTRLLVLLFITMKTSSIVITSTNKDFLPEEHRVKVIEALKYDSFFGNLEEVRALGNGSYGFVLEMKRQSDSSEKRYAMKIGDDTNLIEASFPLTAEMLEIDSSMFNDAITNNIIIEYLHTQKVPYIVRPITYRSVLFTHNGKPVHKYIQLMELADAGDMKKLAQNNTKLDQSTKDNLVKDLMFKLLISFNDMNKQGVLHGDIKPANIFLENCQQLNSTICPVVGDFDISIYLKHEKRENGLKYTHYYRPIEMHYFTDNENEKLLRGATGYKYTGKEDVFALAVTIVEFGLRLGYEFDQPMKDLIAKMTFPLSYNCVVSFAQGDMETRFNNIENLIQQMPRQIPQSFTDNANMLDSLAFDVLMALGIDQDLNEELSKIYEGKGDRMRSAYTILQRQMRRKRVGPEIVREKLEASRAAEYFNLEKELEGINPFKDMVDVRYTMYDSLLALYEIMHPGFSLDIKKQQVDAITNLVKEADAVYRIEFDFLRSYVTVFPDFYNLDLRILWNMCDDYNLLMKGTDRPPITTVNPHTNIIESHSVYDFCSQLLNLIRDQQRKNELKKQEQKYHLPANIEEGMAQAAVIVNQPRETPQFNGMKNGNVLI